MDDLLPYIKRFTRFTEAGRQTPLWSGRELLKFCNVNLNPFNPKGRKKHSANSNPVAVTRLQVSKNADVLVGYLAWLLRVPLIPRQDFCQFFVCWEITLTNHHKPGFQACGFYSVNAIAAVLRNWTHRWVLRVYGYWPHMLHWRDMQLAIRLHNPASIPGCLGSFEMKHILYNKTFTVTQ